MLRLKKEQVVPITIGAFFVLLFAFSLYLRPFILEKPLRVLQNLSYDLILRVQHKPLSKTSPILVVDIDDLSLSVEGRWPWNRKKMATLIDHLFQMGAKVVACDIIFSEKEENIAEELLKQTGLRELVNFQADFDYDALLAKQLQGKEVLLGFALTNQGPSVGTLPEPLFVMEENGANSLSILEKQDYLANLSVFQNAAKGGGFINADPDLDGIVRSSPLLLSYKNYVFPSLSLAATRLFLNSPSLQIVTRPYQGKMVLEAIRLGNQKIPTDPWGRVLIPFRGPPYSAPYISATKILSKEVSKEQIEGKLVFIGSSATAIGDLVPTSIAPVFAGVEVHAHIASGILDGYLPFRPTWERGAKVLLVLVVGIILAFCLPLLGPVFSSIFSFGSIFLMLILSYYLWERFQIVFSVISPIFVALILYSLNEIYGYFFVSKRRKELRSIFGQYVPKERIDVLLDHKESLALEGENKELSVLFSDIRNFTALSEKMSAPELKAFLNRYFTPMTKIVFESKGTVDKYVGDMIMAFWGAPVEDLEHSKHSIECAFMMQKELGELNETLKKEGKEPLTAGIGVNSGDMNVGDMGSEYRRAYTVLGDAVNIASRLEAVSKLYQVPILVGEKCYEKTKEEFLFRLIDRLALKGKEQSIGIYQPLCLRNQATQELLSQVQEHEKGIDAYLNQRFDEAKAIFEKLKGKEPLYDYYLSEIEKKRG